MTCLRTTAPACLTVRASAQPAERMKESEREITATSTGKRRLSTGGRWAALQDEGAKEETAGEQERARVRCGHFSRPRVL